MAASDEPPLTRILERARTGDAEAMEQALSHLYDELKGIARRRMRGGGPAETLQPTALVHEAFLRLVGRDQPWESRGHFLGVAARAMRSILVDHARARKAIKRGGDRQREPLDAAAAWFEDHQLDLLALDEALQQFATVDPEACRVVELRYFAGLTNPRIAEVTGLSLATVERRWAMARGWLHQTLHPEEPA